MSVSKKYNRGKIRKYVISLAIAILIGTVCVLLTGAVVSAFSDPAEYITSAALTSLAISSVLSGFFSAKITGDGAVSGCITGTAVTLISALLSLILFERSFPAGISFVLHAVQVLLFVLGAFTSSHGKKKTKLSKKYKRIKR